MPHKVMIQDKKKSTKDPPHPCDPPAPCDPCEVKQCEEPKLCKERIKNPLPGWQTKCQKGAFINAGTCKPEEDHHPCDEPPPCVPGKPKVSQCPTPALNLGRIQNPGSKIIRCPGEIDEFSPILCENRELLRTPIPVCKDKCGRPKIITINPFEEEDERLKEEEARKAAEAEADKLKVKRDLPAHLYQDTLCKYKEVLKTPIKSCMQSPCQQVMVFNPEELEEQAEENEKEFAEPDKDPCVNRE